MSMLKSKPIAPTVVPTDKVYPVHFWDDTKILRPLILYQLMRVDDALDAEKLKAALVKLLNRDGWRNLGARLRLNSKGKLEFHVPAHFDEKRPPISFHHEPHRLSITEHALASRLPKASTSPQIVCNVDDFLPLVRQPEDPQCLEDYIHTDRPMLGLHIVTFSDATLVTLSWSHVHFDLMGCKALLDAWSLILQGRDDQVPSLHGIDTDPLATLGTRSTEPYEHVDKQLSIGQSLIFGLRIMFDQKIRRPKGETRIVCVPAAHVESMHKAALAEITSAAHKGEKGVAGPPFISKGDLLCAWWARSSRMAKKASRTIVIQIVFGLRWILAQEGMLPTSKSYVANATSGVPTFVSEKGVLNRPLGDLAAALRKSIAELGTREQIEARVALDRAAQDKYGYVALFGDPWMDMVICTNWTKGKLYDVDFSGAVVSEGRHLAKQKAGRPSFIQVHVFGAKLYSSINGFSILGKDAEGNYWLQGLLSKKGWLKFEQRLHEELSNGV